VATEKERFQDAYNLAVVEHDTAGAISICHEILKVDPTHLNARMLIGCLLSDSPDMDQRNSGRKHFLIALQTATFAKDRTDQWLEENPFYQLALWERTNGSKEAAAVIFAIDFVLNRTSSSREQIYEMVIGDPSSATWNRLKETFDSIFLKIESHK
jgi:hypothetical protein